LLNRDEAKQNLQQLIAAGLEANEKRLNEYQKSWDDFRELWDVDKERFIARYEERNPDVSRFEADILRYIEVANMAQSRETFTTIQFVSVDCTPLKNALYIHCLQWQGKLIGMICSFLVAERHCDL
jgi:dynein heavy chain, axonemal